MLAGEQCRRPRPGRDSLPGNKPGLPVASDGTHVWVANDQSVTELSASTAAPVKVRYGSKYGFSDPDAIASDGKHVWLTNNFRLVT